MKGYLIGFYVAVAVTAKIAQTSPTTSVWDTTTFNDAEFCKHKFRGKTPQYEQFFNGVVNTGHSFTESLEHLDLITNIIVVLPEFIHCHPPMINLVVETHIETAELRQRLKSFAVKMKESLHTEIRILLKVQDVPFAIWKPHKGVYILCKDRTENAENAQSSTTSQQRQRQRQTLGRQEWEMILQLARRRRIEVTSGWNEEECAHLSIGTFSGTTNLQHFQRDLESRLNRRTRLILN